MVQLKQINSAQDHILYDAAQQLNIDTQWFVSNYWHEKNSVTGMAQGRGNTLFISCQGQELVLRHYRRGGFVSKILNDQYFWLGLKRSRAWRECKLLAKMCDMGLPVPTPVAAHVQRRGIYYHADLITEKISNARSLADSLSDGSISDESWAFLGTMIATFHNAGIDHADLNAHNVLLKEERFYLIDFDRGRVRSCIGGWQQSNIKRFHRSLRKLFGLRKKFSFNQNNWSSFLNGYNMKINSKELSNG
jgi:3-deoxy-D-manno-octulosonic acid kinase